MKTFNYLLSCIFTISLILTSCEKENPPPTIQTKSIQNTSTTTSNDNSGSNLRGADPFAKKPVNEAVRGIEREINNPNWSMLKQILDNGGGYRRIEKEPLSVAVEIIEENGEFVIEKQEQIRLKHFIKNEAG